MNPKVTFLSLLLFSFSSFAQSLPVECNNAMNVLNQVRQNAGSPMSLLKAPITVAYYNRVSYLPVMLTYIQSSDDKEFVVLEQTGLAFNQPLTNCSLRGYSFRKDPKDPNEVPFVIGVLGATLNEVGP